MFAEIDSAESGSKNRVWQVALDRHGAFRSQFSEYIHPKYIEGLRRLDFGDKMPTVGSLNSRLAGAGWQVREVRGYLPVREYIALVARHVFPVSCLIRPIECIDYAPEPDFIHDVLGHLPWLFWPDYSRLIVSLARLMLQILGEDLTVEIISDEKQLAFESLLRLSWWSLEFGLLRSPDSGMWIIGAGLISAPGEATAIIRREVPLKPFGHDALACDISFSTHQEGFFIAGEFGDYVKTLDLICSRDKKFVFTTLDGAVRR